MEPSSIAIIGASSVEGKAGNAILKNLIKFSYSGKIYLINPNEKEILGHKCYKNIKEVPNSIDLAFIVIPAPLVLQAVKDCVNKVKYAVIISAGFKEASEEGKKLEEEIVRVARSGGMRIIGPNCLGIINSYNNLIATAVTFDTFRKDNIAFLAQSGVLAGSYAKWIIDTQKFGIGVSISLGNKSDLDEVEIINGYLKDDPNIKVIGVYSEEIKDGRKFVEVMKETTKHKPVIMIKSGRTKEGARAILSHTGSLAGDDAIVDAALRQTGVIRVEDFGDLLDLVKVFDYCPLPKGNRVGIMTLSGASSALAIDMISKMGLRLANLEEETKKWVEKEIMPPYQPAKNPLDVWIALGAGAEKVHRVSIGALLRDPNVDMVLAIMLALPPSYFDAKKVFPEFLELVKKKPLIAATEGDKKTEEWFNILEEMKIPVFTGQKSIKSAAKAMGALYQYKMYLEKIGVA
ncbi:acetate--CoA ligase family protein [Fervidicoccus sp.]|uniref:acetate--CoA ligase family protein n=1 Tax=Fervidicoccus sp. TaxID=2060324 RepID=UPI003D0C63E6